jgi:hypothetical protein
MQTPLFFREYAALRYALRRGVSISIPDSPIATAGVLPASGLWALAWDSSKGLLPVRPQAVEQQAAKLAILGGQPSKGFEPLVVVALFLRVVRHSAFASRGRPTSISPDYNFA